MTNNIQNVKSAGVTSLESTEIDTVSGGNQLPFGCVGTPPTSPFGGEPALINVTEVPAGFLGL